MCDCVLNHRLLIPRKDAKENSADSPPIPSVGQQTSHSDHSGLIDVVDNHQLNKSAGLGGRGEPELLQPIKEIVLFSFVPFLIQCLP